MIKYCIRQCSVADVPGGKNIGSLSVGDIVYFAKTLEDSPGFDVIEMYNHKIGYVPSDYLAEFLDPFSPSVLRIPEDREIILAGNSQYIDIKAVIGRKYIHYNLCGEFAAAVAASMDVIPFLQQWYTAWPGAKNILEHNKPTGNDAIISMLACVGLLGKVVNFHIYNPASPMKLVPGSILGVGINQWTGRIVRGGWTRHWVLLENVYTVANTAFLRVYNSRWNRIEIERFDQFLEKNGSLTMIEVS